MNAVPAIRVLVVEDDDEDYLLIRNLFERQGRLGQAVFELTQASSAEDALARLKDNDWSFFIVDVQLDPEGQNGAEFVRAAIQAGVAVPALMISGDATLSLGADALELIEQDQARFLPKKDLNWQSLTSVLRDMVHREMRVLLVEDDPDDLLLLRTYLGDADVVGVVFSVDCAATLDEALGCARQQAYDLVLLDYRLGKKRGTELIEQMQWRGSGPLVVLVTGFDHVAHDPQAVGLIGAGHCRFLSKSQLSQDTLMTAIFGPGLAADREDRLLLEGLLV